MSICISHRVSGMYAIPHTTKNLIARALTLEIHEHHRHAGKWDFRIRDDIRDRGVTTLRIPA